MEQSIEVSAERVREVITAQRNAALDELALSRAFSAQILDRVRELEAENAKLKLLNVPTEGG